MVGKVYERTIGVGLAMSLDDLVEKPISVGDRQVILLDNAGLLTRYRTVWMDSADRGGAGCERPGSRNSLAVVGVAPQSMNDDKLAG